MPRTPASLHSPREVVVYENGVDVRVEATTDGETIWLTQSLLAELFQVDRSVIAKHVRNIYRTGELDESATCAKNAQVRMEGARRVVREVLSYNLDMIIAVGYRVNSLRATRFRQWATRMLREMLLRKLDEVKRIAALERRMDKNEAGLKRVQAGVSYLVQQLSAPPPVPPKPKIGFQ